MRITNNMMLKNTMSNIYGNKQNVNTLNNQMSSQKKIVRPSEDPVIAIRALRLRSNLSEIEQFYERNIPDAEAWLDVTETALMNMESILSDVRTQCTYGANGTLTIDDRDAILKSLTQLREQLYAEGNTDYAGRTVFTGYHTNKKLTFDSDETNTSYQITQTFTKADIEDEHRYYRGNAAIPTDTQLSEGTEPANVESMMCDRIRFAYNDITDGSFELKFTDGTLNKDGALEYQSLADMKTVDGEAVEIKYYENIDAWKNARETNFETGLKDNEIIVIADTGEMLLGKDVSATLDSKNYRLSVDYSKKGFAKGEVRPEYYFNCTDTTDELPENHVKYTKYDEAGKEIKQDINYTIAYNQTLTINTNASDVLSENAGRDVDEMMDAVQYAMDAHDKIDKIKAMMSLEEYSGEESQQKLQKWLDTAQKEADFADDNVKKLFNSYIKNFDSYLVDVNLAITTVGSKGQQLALTENRMSTQQLTITELKSKNEDRELADIIIEYTSAYTAYEAALQAAGKINQNTLLNFI